jgi:Beta-lactamase enzyme family
VARRPRPSPISDSLVPAGAGESFNALAASLPGQVGLAVAPLGAGGIQSFGAAQIAHAWSTSKVPVLVTLLRDYESSNRVLGPEGNTDATLALEQSDNAAIEALFGQLEQIHGGLVPASDAVTQTLRTAGDQTTVINTAPNNEGFTTYGQTEWSLPGEITFYRALARGCLLDQADTSYVLGLMENVIPSQRWGAGSAGYPSAVPIAFKGGWGPDSSGNYQVRQTAIIGAGHRGYVVSMLALPASGAFSDGTTMLTALANWARREFNLDAVQAPASCAGPQ